VQAPRWGLLAALAAAATALGAGEARAQLGPDLGAELPYEDHEAEDLLGREIARVEFRGNRRVEDDAIRVNLVTQPGTRLDLAQVREDIRAVWDMGFFSDVQVEAEPSPEGLIVTFVVAEQPGVRRVVVTGHDQLSLSKINEVIDLRRDALLDVAKVKQNVTKIRDLYVSEGYYLAEVTHEIREVDEANVEIWFRVDESSRVEIRDVSFLGNEAVPDETLRQIITTRPGNFLSFLTDAGTYKAEAFERDLMMITAYYYDHGYINVSIGRPLIRLSRDRRFMYLTIPIDEGPQFRIGEIDFRGDLIGDKADYYERLTVEPGQIFNRSRVSQDIQRLTHFYQDQGYAYVNPTPLTDVDLEDLTVALTFDIDKGEKVYFERINIRGNDKTRDKVIRREMKIAEGELYSQTALEESQRRINALGFFEAVNLSTTRGATDEFIEVNVQVGERPTGTFQVGAGFSSVENFIAQAQISQENLLGRGQSLSLQAQLSSLRQLFQLRFVEPYFLDTMWTFAFDLYNQAQGFGQFARDARGGNLTWGRRLNFETRAFLTYKLENVNVRTGRGRFTDVNFFGEEIATESVANLFRGGFTSSVRAALQWDSRNNRLFPTDGWYHNAFLEVADTFTGSQNVFVRYGGFARHYRPIVGPFILKLNAEVGVTTSRDPLGVPITERYLIGGIHDVRGFRPRSLGPRLRVSEPGDVGEPLGNIPLGGNMQLIWNSEIEFPLFEQVGISGVVFFDMGNAYNLERRYCSGSAGADVSPKFDPCFDFPTSLTTGLRKSVGWGIRWFSPIGPLRFEWGVPLDRQPNEDSVVFEFTIGNFF
jgi:outer membrane protein insertion porin family